MGFFILKSWDWCHEGKGFCKGTEYDLTNILKVLLKWVKLSLEKSEHHTRQLVVANPFLIIAKPNEKKQRRHKITCPKCGFSCSKDSFVVNQTFVFQIRFFGKSPALRVAAIRSAGGHAKTTISKTIT